MDETLELGGIRQLRARAAVNYNISQTFKAIESAAPEEKESPRTKKRVAASKADKRKDSHSVGSKGSGGRTERQKKRKASPHRWLRKPAKRRHEDDGGFVNVPVTRGAAAARSARTAKRDPDIGSGSGSDRESDCDSDSDFASSRSADSGARRRGKETKRHASSGSDDDDDEEEDSLSETSEDDDDDEEQAGEARIDRILAFRRREGDALEFLIKFKDVSYLHIRWLSDEEVEEMPGGKQRVVRIRRECEELEDHPLFLAEGEDQHASYSQEFTKVCGSSPPLPPPPPLPHLDWRY
jgi:hypothetical protein